MPSRRHRPGSLTRKATIVNPTGWNGYRWEMVKNRKTIACWDCDRDFLRGEMMYRPKMKMNSPRRKCGVVGIV